MNSANLTFTITGFELISCLELPSLASLARLHVALEYKWEMGLLVYEVGTHVYVFIENGRRQMVRPHIPHHCPGREEAHFGM